MDLLDVLIVEDDPSTQRALKRMLSRLGHESTLAGDVHAAIEQLEQRSPDLVLLDLNLPGPNAYGMLRHLDSTSSRVPVIAMSSGGDVDDLISFMRLGAIDFLKKPISLGELEAAIARALRRREQISRYLAASAGEPPPAASQGTSKEEPSNEETSRGEPSNAEHLTGRPEHSLVERISITLDSLRNGRLDLPVLGSLATSVFRLLEDDHCGVDDVVDLASSDPGFATSVVRSANSGAYSSARQLASLREACMHLGNRRVAAIAQEVLAGRMHALPEGPLADIAKKLWVNSQVTARAVRACAGGSRVLDPEKAHLAALLHNLGELFVLQALQAIADDGGPHITDPATVERICGTIHEQVGLKFLRGWSAPAAVCRVAGNHHSAPTRPEVPAARHLRLLVHDCWCGAVAAGFGYYNSHQGAKFDRLAPDLTVERRRLISASVAAAALTLDD